MGLRIQRYSLHNGADELSEQVAGLVRHVHRYAHLLRILHNSGDNSVRDFVPGMEGDERGRRAGRFLRFSHHCDRHISAERVQGDGRTLRDYKAHVETETRITFELQFEMGRGSGKAVDQDRVPTLA